MTPMGRRSERIKVQSIAKLPALGRERKVALAAAAAAAKELAERLPTRSPMRTAVSEPGRLKALWSASQRRKILPELLWSAIATKHVGLAPPALPTKEDEAAKGLAALADARLTYTTPTPKRTRALLADVVYINMASRADRRRSIENELRKAGLTGTRLEACTGYEAERKLVTRTWDSTLNTKYDTKTLPARLTMSVGERG